jgi:hypothetical protein
MSDIVPRLDTTVFEDLFDRGRADIPRYASAWTDHNLHDPGITLIDLLAWIVDQQVYRAGHVGGRHRQAFAALLGVRPAGPAAARGLVWPDRPPVQARFVEAGAVVTCASHPDLPFLLAESLYLPAVALTGLSLTVGGIVQPMPAPATSGGSWTLGPASPASGSGGGCVPVAGPVLLLEFDGPLGSGAGPRPVSLGIEVPPPGFAPGPGDPPWGPVTYFYRVGGGSWCELRVVGDGTAGLATTGVVVLEIPARNASPGTGSELRIDLGHGFFPMPPQISALSVNVLPVVQQVTVAPAALGGLATGLPDQEVELVTTDLVGLPLEIQVDREEWQPVADLDGSGPADQHYVAGPSSVRFGNGVNGRRPPRGATISHGELARTTGAAGNVRSGLSWSVEDLGLDGAGYGHNHQPFARGGDATSVDRLAEAAGEAALARTALLTDADLADAAYGLTGLAVGRAEVLPGFDHRLPGRRVAGVRTLVVLPRQPAPAPDGTPSELTPASPTYLREVAARLAPRRVLGERLIVRGPVIVPIDVAAVVTVAPGHAAGQVRADVEVAVRQRLAPLVRPLGRDLTVGDVEVRIAAVPGVDTVLSTAIASAGGPSGSDPVPVPVDGLIGLARVDIAVGGGGAG